MLVGASFDSLDSTDTTPCLLSFHPVSKCCLIIIHDDRILIQAPKVFTTLLAGALRLRQNPNEVSLGFVFSQALKCALHCYVFSGAGMVWNDWIDCDIDAKVERTKNRPLASGQVRVSHALIWMAIQYLAAGAILRSAVDNPSV